MISGMSEVWDSVGSVVRCSQGNTNHFSGLCANDGGKQTRMQLIKAHHLRDKSSEIQSSHLITRHQPQGIIPNATAATLCYKLSNKYADMDLKKTSWLISTVESLTDWSRSMLPENICVVINPQLMGQKRWNGVTEMDTVNISACQLSSQWNTFCCPPLNFKCVFVTLTSNRV